jgi:adenosylhomocysteine nucleosidase
MVISETVLHHDLGEILPDSFVPYDTVGYAADSALLSVAQMAAERAVFDTLPKGLSKDTTRTLVVLIGRIATGDQFISSEKKRQWLETRWHADCVEMEGAAVAQVCVLNAIPFVIIRSVSDLANENTRVDFPLFVAYASKNSSQIVLEMIKILSQ